MNAAALLLLDFQAATCDPADPIAQETGLAAEAGRRDVIGAATNCLRAAREAGLTVVHSRLAWDAEYLRRTNRSAMMARFEEAGAMVVGSAETAFVPELEPRAGEVIVDKPGVDPLVATPLLAILRARSVGRLYLGGIATNFVVESAARHAGDLGFEVTVLEDLCSSFDQASHDFAITVTLPAWARIASSDQFLAELG
jgi:nicotinamidase-related amidase